MGKGPKLNGSPAEPLLRLLAGSRTVHTKEGSDPAKIIGSCLARLASDGYIQRPANGLSDVSSRYALVCHAVIALSTATLLKRNPVEMRCIQPMHCRPAVESIPYVRGNALFSCNPDQA